MTVWRICLAPRPRSAPVGRHWWRELVTQTFRDWSDVYAQQMEAACAGWATEEAEYRAAHPPPTLRHVLEGLSQGSMFPNQRGLI